MSRQEAFVVAIRTAMDEKGFNQAELARRVGVQQPSISDWVNGKKQPSRKNRAKLLEVLDLTEEDIERVARTRTRALLDAGDDVVYVPHMAVDAGGEGSPKGGRMKRVGRHPYSRRELRRLTKVDPAELRTVTMVDDAMEPEIRAGDTVGYRPAEEVSGDGIYVFLLDGTLKVRRLQRCAGGAIELIPRNGHYDSEMLIPLEDADAPDVYRSRASGVVGGFELVGKVKFYLRSV